MNTMENDMDTPTRSSERTDSLKAVEFLQALSVLCLAGAAIAYMIHNRPLTIALGAAGFSSFLLPNLILFWHEHEQRSEERKAARRLARSMRNLPAFMVTPTRLRILKEILPPDVQDGLVQLTNERYDNEEEIRFDINYVLGEARAKDYLDTVLSHTRVRRPAH